MDNFNNMGGVVYFVVVFFFFTIFHFTLQVWEMQNSEKNT